MVQMKKDQSRDLIQRPLKDSNIICLNAMKTDFNYETVLLSLDIIFIAMSTLTQEISVVVLLQQGRKKS